MKNGNPAWLDNSHPNFKRWQHARELSIERGKFVRAIVNQNIKTKNLTVLDLGSGEGGTSMVFSENNFVASLDLSLVRLKRQQLSVISNKGFYPTEKSKHLREKDFSIEDSLQMTKPNLVNGSALKLPFTNQSFDLIIIQDVIEHLTEVNTFYSEVKRVLKGNGNIYLSSPNKLSIFNFISDPHFGLPMASLLKRESIKKYFLKYFRKADYSRSDIAQLLSLKDMQNIFKNDFELSLLTKFSVHELFKGNKGIVWSSFHLQLISFCQKLKIDWLINKIANDKFGLVNKFFTPTFYMLVSRKNKFD